MSNKHKMTNKIQNPNDKKFNMETIEGYNEILRDIRSLLEKATYQAYKAVDNLRVQTYWQIGERISRGELEHKGRADYGKQAIDNLAVDLGFQKRVIYRMLQFYKTYPIVSTLSTQLRKNDKQYFQFVTHCVTN